MSKSTFWVKMFYAEFCAHYDGMSDEEIVADVKASRTAFMNVLATMSWIKPKDGCFAEYLINKAMTRVANLSDSRSNAGKKSGEVRRTKSKKVATEQPPAPKRTRKPATPRHAYGPAQNILLTDAEYSKLTAEIPALDTLIAKMSEWCKAKGHAYKDYAAALRMWHRKDEERNNQPTAKSFQQMERDRQSQLMREWYPDVMDEYGL